jgi:hypothetical protein
MIPVEGYSGLYRDEHSGGIINCNTTEYADYIKAKEIKILKEMQLAEMRSEIAELKRIISQAINYKI